MLNLFTLFIFRKHPPPPAKVLTQNSWGCLEFINFTGQRRMALFLKMKISIPSGTTKLFFKWVFLNIFLLNFCLFLIGIWLFLFYILSVTSLMEMFTTASQVRIIFYFLIIMILKLMDKIILAFHNRHRLLLRWEDGGKIVEKNTVLSILYVRWGSWTDCS